MHLDQINYLRDAIKSLTTCTTLSVQVVRVVADITHLYSSHDDEYQVTYRTSQSPLPTLAAWNGRYKIWIGEEPPVPKAQEGMTYDWVEVKVSRTLLQPLLDLVERLNLGRMELLEVVSLYLEIPRLADNNSNLKEDKMNFDNLFTIADAAKRVGDYEVANWCFAVMALEAITAAEHAEDPKVFFVYEYDDEDIVTALADPHGAGRYDLIAMVGMGEDDYLCIPMPLVSKWFINRLLIDGVYMVPRNEYHRKYWRLTEERRAMASRDLRRRLAQEVDEETLERAVRLVLD